MWCFLGVSASASSFNHFRSKIISLAYDNIKNVVYILAKVAINSTRRLVNFLW